MIKAFLLYSWLIFHPVHVTLSSIDYSKESDSFKVFLKMYYDDFLLDSGQTSLSTAPADTDRLKEKVTGYLENKFMIYADKKKLKGKIENLKLIDGELVINMYFNSVSPAGSVKVKNLIMTSLYNDQSNMLIIKTDKIEEGLKLTPEKTEHTFNVN